VLFGPFFLDFCPKILSQPEGCSMTSPLAGNTQPMVRAEKLTADTCIEDSFGSDL